MTPSVTAESFLSALQSKQNVIVLIAHAKRETVFFSQPLPDGSEVHPQDIRNLSAEIHSNRPTVYLFCCETAQYDGIQSISEALLDCGVAAVVAPQQVIQADKSRELFSKFLDHGSRNGTVPLVGLRNAENEVGDRDMETWLG
jgi:hypothetical protein